MLERYNFAVSEFTYLISLPLVLCNYMYYKRSASTDFLDIDIQSQKPLFYRCMAGFLTDIALYLAFTFTSYSTAFCVGKTETLFSPFIAYYVIGERIKIVDLVGILIGFGGMLLLLQPWNQQHKTSFENDAIGIIWAILASILGAMTFVYCRLISDKFHHSVPPIYYMLLSCICTPLFYSMQPQQLVLKQPIYNLEMFLFLLATVLVQFLHVILFCASWQYNTVGTTAVLVYLGIPIGYILDWIFIGREISAIELVGATLIFFTNITIVSLRLLQYIK